MFISSLIGVIMSFSPSFVSSLTPHVMRTVCQLECQYYRMYAPRYYLSISHSTVSIVNQLAPIGFNLFFTQVWWHAVGKGLMINDFSGEHCVVVSGIQLRSIFAPSIILLACVSCLYSVERNQAKSLHVSTWTTSGPGIIKYALGMILWTLQFFYCGQIF